MTKFGYAISSEEHPPQDIVRHAQRAESIGFTFALISDHFHPWISAQGQSPFVWTSIGAIAQATTRLIVGTGVTCPIMRIHPAIIAQAAATAAALMPSRFFLGVGTGENLNEHIIGKRWPPHDVRLSMLEEAVGLMRMLWQGDTQSYWGRFFTVEDAKLFTLPEMPPSIMIAASGPTAAAVAGRLGDGLIGTAPDADTVTQFMAGGDPDRPKIGQITVCWAPSEAEAKRIVHRIWPNAGLSGELSQELRTVAHFEQAATMVSEEASSKQVPCGPDPEVHLQAIQKYIDAGFDHIYLHQIGPDQEGFFRFYAREVLPHLS